MSARLRISAIVLSGIRLNSTLSSILSGRLVHRAAHLLERPLDRGRFLLLLADARLVVVLAPPELGQNPRLLAGLLETLERALEGLALLDLDHGHVIPSISVGNDRPASDPG